MLVRNFEEYSSDVLLRFKVPPSALLNTKKVVEDAIRDEFSHMRVSIGHHDDTIALRRNRHHERHERGHGARVVEHLVALKHPGHPAQPVRDRAHEQLLMEVVERPRALELPVPGLGYRPGLGHHHAEVLGVVQHVRDDGARALVGPHREAGGLRRLPDVPPAAVHPVVPIGDLEPAGLEQRVPIPEEGLVHSHRPPQVLVEEITQPGPRQHRDKVSGRGPHHIVVLERGPGLRRHGKVAQAAHYPPRVIGTAASADGQVVPRVPRAVAEGVLDGDVGGGPAVAEDKVLAQQPRHGRVPRDGRVVRGVVDQQREGGCRVGLGGAARPEEGVRRH